RAGAPARSSSACRGGTPWRRAARARAPPACRARAGARWRERASGSACRRPRRRCRGGAAVLRGPPGRGRARRRARGRRPASPARCPARSPAVRAALSLAGVSRIPFYTRGEPREGLVVQEMVKTDAWLVPVRPDDEPARKPPLYYWAAATALTLLPARPELALRLPSAALGAAAVLATWATARVGFGATVGLPAALVLATSFEWVRAATSARVDMALAACLTAVLAAWTFAL